MTNRLITLLMKQTQMKTRGQPSVSDAVLLNDFVRDDDAAFATLVQRHGPMVWAVCRNALGRESDAEDAFQATFLALIRSAGRIRQKATVGAWLHGVAVKICLQARRTAARRNHREAKLALTARTVTAPDTWHDDLAEVHEKIKELPQREHSVFVLCVLEGLPQAEAARRLGLQLGSVSGLLSRARKRLRAQLSSKGAFSALALAVVASSPTLVPANLLSQTLNLTQSTSGLSPAIGALAASLTEVTMRKTMLLLAVLVLGTGVAGTFWLSGVEAQQPPSTRPVQAPAGAQANPFTDLRGMVVSDQNTSWPSSSRSQWEYKVVQQAPTGEIESTLNKLGSSGWELCSTSGVANTPQVVFVFKRPVIVVRGQNIGQRGSSTEVTTSPSEAGQQGSVQDRFTNSWTTLNDQSNDGLEVEVRPLTQTEAVDIARLLNNLGGTKVVADTRTNSVVIRAKAADLAKIKKLLEALDRPVQKGL